MTGEVSESAWYKLRLSALFEAVIAEDQLVEGTELIRKKRVLDFLLAPGMITAKVQDEAPRPLRVSMTWPQASEDSWDVFAKQLSQHALYLASLLSGDFPSEFEEASEKASVILIPRDLTESRLSCDCGKAPSCSHRAAVYYKLVERVIAEPFSLFLLCGHGREETASAVAQLRSELRKNSPTDERGPAPVTFSRRVSSEYLQGFWSANPEVFQISYTIRADDLPAALLKRLEPAPVGDLETIAEMTLEDAYAHVARRAQAFGLGLAKAK